MKSFGDQGTVQRVLPHRYPFLLVDRLISCQKGTGPFLVIGLKAEAIKCVTINEPFFQGHFPHKAIMPGVLIVEAMAQVGGLAICMDLEEEKDMYLVGVDKCRFRVPVVPGDQLRITLLGMKYSRGLLWFECKAFVEDQVVAEAILIAKIIPRVGEGEEI